MPRATRSRKQDKAEAVSTATDRTAPASGQSSPGPESVSASAPSDAETAAAAEAAATEASAAGVKALVEDLKPTTSVVTLSKAEGPVVTTTTAADAIPSPSKLPRAAQFPLVAVLSLALSALGHSLAHPWAKAVLAPHARVLEGPSEMGILLAWRV